MEISWKNMQQLLKPKYGFLSNMRYVTIRNNLNPVYTWFKTIDFDSKLIYWWENELLSHFCLFIFSVEKNKPIKSK